MGVKLVGRGLFEGKLPRCRAKQKRLIMVHVLQKGAVIADGGIQRETIRYDPEPIGNPNAVLTVAKQETVRTEARLAMLVHTRISEISAEPDLVTYGRFKAHFCEEILESKNECG